MTSSLPASFRPDWLLHLQLWLLSFCTQDSRHLCQLPHALAHDDTTVWACTSTAALCYDLALYLAALPAVFARCIGACCPLVCSEFVIYLLCGLSVVRVCLVCHYLQRVILLAVHAFLLQLL